MISSSSSSSSSKHNNDNNNVHSDSNINIDTVPLCVMGPCRSRV